MNKGTHIVWGGLFPAYLELASASPPHITRLHPVRSSSSSSSSTYALEDVGFQSEVEEERVGLWRGCFVGNSAFLVLTSPILTYSWLKKKAEDSNFQSSKKFFFYAQKSQKHIYRFINTAFKMAFKVWRKVWMILFVPRLGTTLDTMAARRYT